MAEQPDFSKLVPGFDFLQKLVGGAGAAMPAMGQWVAPTLNPEELEKRINELRTVQFWLEQNARMLGATIQALEVQRMTLTTLKTMNVQMGVAGSDAQRARAVSSMVAVAGVTALDVACATAVPKAQAVRQAQASHDYSDRSGLPQDPECMRGAALANFEMPADMRIPDALRPYTLH